MTRRRVLFLTTEWPSEESPVTGIFVREFALAATTVADVTAVHVQRAPGSHGLFEIATLQDGVPVRRVKYRRFRKPLSLLAFVLGARSAIRASGRSFDVVHTHSFLSTLLARLFVRGTPIVYTEPWSVFLPDSPYQLRPAMRVLAKRALRSATIVLPPSLAMREALSHVVPGLRMRVIPNVVDTTLFSPNGTPSSASGHRLVTVGMMPPSHVKGFDLLLRAVRLLADNGTDVTLDVAGDGPLRVEYEELARSLGITERVRFHGVRSKTEINALLNRADLFVLASRFDNNPCVVIESMAAGLPVVATRVGGVPEMVDASSGVLVDPQSPDALAAGIEDVLARLEDFDALRISTAAAARYGQAQIAGELDAVYEEATATSVGRARTQGSPGGPRPAP